MSAHVLLNLLNELAKKIRCEAVRILLAFFAANVTIVPLDNAMFLWMSTRIL